MSILSSQGSWEQLAGYYKERYWACYLTQKHSNRSFCQLRTQPVTETSKSCAPSGVCLRRSVPESGVMMPCFSFFQPQDKVFRLATSLGNLGLEPGAALWMGDDGKPGWTRLLHQVGWTHGINSLIFGFGDVSVWTLSSGELAYLNWGLLGTWRPWLKQVIPWAFHILWHEVALFLDMRHFRLRIPRVSGIPGPEQTCMLLNPGPVVLIVRG